MFEFGKRILSNLGIVDGYHDVPSVDGTDNLQMRDVIGNKTDARTSDSLVAIAKQIEQEAFETEHHLHGQEKWFGLAGTPAGETHRADRVTLKPEPFRIDAGNDTWSAWLQILGSTDTPVVSTKTKFDLHELQVVLHERNSTTHVIQVIFGESSGLAAKLAAEDFTEKTFITPTAPAGEMGTVEIQDERMTKGTKAWARIWAKGADTGYVDFYIGLHEYLR